MWKHSSTKPRTTASNYSENWVSVYECARGVSRTRTNKPCMKPNIWQDPLCLHGLHNISKQPRFSLYLLYKERWDRGALLWTVAAQLQAQISRHFKTPISRSDEWVISPAAHATDFSDDQRTLNKECCSAQNRRPGWKTLSQQNNYLLQPVCVRARLQTVWLYNGLINSIS